MKVNVMNLAGIRNCLKVANIKILVRKLKSFGGGVTEEIVKSRNQFYEYIPYVCY